MVNYNYINLIFSIIILIFVIGLILFYYIDDEFTQPVYLGPAGPINKFSTIGPTGPTGPNNINVGPTGPTGPTGSTIKNINDLNNSINVQPLSLPLISDLSDGDGDGEAQNINFGVYYYFQKYLFDDCNKISTCNKCDNCGDDKNIKSKYYLNLNQVEEPRLGDYFVINTIGLKDLNIDIAVYGGSNSNMKFKLFDDNEGDNTWGNELPTLNLIIQPNNIYYFYYIGNTMGTNNSDKSPGPFFVVSVSIFSFD